MTYRLARLSAFVLALTLTACGSEVTPDSDSDVADLDASVGLDAGPRGDDGGAPDGGMLDSGSRADAGSDSPDGGAAQTCGAPGTIEEVSCGRCGAMQRFCTSSGVWEQGPCEAETGTCAPGQTQDAACGMCGEIREVCTAECVWEPLGECIGEGGCSPGDLIRSSEGCAAGQRDLRCNDACVLEPAGECIVDACDTAGQSENVDCGNCGQATRFCTSAHQWEYGPCMSEGVCEAGTSGTTDCGNCGTQSQRCDASCQWTDFGICTDEGECAPGSVGRSAEGCGPGSSRPLSCNDVCVFESAGVCVAADAERGESCASSDCVEGLFCDESQGFPICHEACDASAPACTEGFCQALIEGFQDFCSDQCEDEGAATCPDASTCGFFGISGGFPGFIAGTPVMLCRLNGSGGQGDACEYGADCQDQHSCRIPAAGDANYCARICRAEGECMTGYVCDIGINPMGVCVRPEDVTPGFPIGT